MKSEVILGSGSPRRLQLIRTLGVEPRVVSPDIDESVRPGELAADYVRRLAAEKRDAVMKNLGSVGVGTVVITADTTVEVDGRILGKPEIESEAIAMLQALSGREHRVHTGLAVAVAGPGCRGVEWDGHVEVVTTTVWFRDLDAAEITRYVATGEPLDKAGAYAIQGGASGFVERLEGPLDSVVGLPVDRLVDICAGLGQPLSASAVSKTESR
jgi:septum formation protein